MQRPRHFSCLFPTFFSKWCHDFKQWQRHFSFFSSLIFLVQHRSIAVLFHFVCSPVRLSIDTFQLTHLSGDRKKALRRSSDLTCASDLIDLDPLSLNRVERHSSFRPGDRDFNHEWTSNGLEESNQSIDFAIFVQLQHSCFPIAVAINSLHVRDQIWR